MCLASRVRSCDGATLIRRRLGILPTNLGGSPARRLGRAAIAFARDSSAARRPRSMDANLFFFTIERKHPAVQVEGDVQPGFQGRRRSRVDGFKKKRPVDPRKKRAGGCSRSRFHHDSPTVKLVRGDQFWMLHAICADLRDRNIVVWRSQLGHQKQHNNEGVRPGGDPQHYRVSARNTHQLNTPPLQW